MLKGTRKQLYSVIDRMLKNEEEIKAAVMEALVKRSGGGGPASNDPTSISAMRMSKPVPCITLASGLLVWQPETWLYLIDWTYRNSTPQEKQVAELYYRKHKNIVSICTRCLECPSTTAYGLLNRFKQRAMEGACQLGLVKIFSLEIQFREFLADFRGKIVI